jgi:hypothetical protein
MQRHPWNVRFEWLDHRGPFGALNREQVRRYDQYTVARGGQPVSR